MKRFLFFILACLFMSLPNESKAQHQHINGVCGTSAEDLAAIEERLVRYKATMPDNIANSRETTFLPLKLHLIADDDGLGRVRIRKVLEQLHQLNIDFADFEAHFYIKDGFNMINNTRAWNDPGGVNDPFGAIAVNNNRVSNAMNLFIAKNATTGNPTEGGTTLAYYSRSDDWLVSRKNQINASSGTISHEVGHYFQLLHTFSGWDFQTYAQWREENPSANVPSFAPGTGIRVENEDRNGACRNCDDAGDRLCDTPPDYNFGFGWGGGCDYTNSVMDPCGVEVDPMEDNFMSYFLSCSEYQFTDDQKNVMRMDLDDRIAAFAGQRKLDVSYDPIRTEITSPAVHTFPEDGSVIDFFNVVTLNWQAVEGATHYLIEVDRFNTFDFDEFDFVVEGQTSVTIENVLDDNRVYHWRVIPFNEGYGGAPIADSWSFRTGSNPSAVEEVEEIGALTIQPNPVKANQDINIELKATTSFEATISLFNITGQLVTSKAHQFVSGTSNTTLSTDNLSAGLYMMSIQTPDGGVRTEKVVIR